MRLKFLSVLMLLTASIANAEMVSPGCYAGPLTYTPPFCCPWERCHDVLNNWSINGAFLWWQANADGVALGEEVFIHRNGLNPADGIYDNVSRNAKAKNPKFKFDPGFKIGIAYAYPGNCWDIGFKWTCYRTTAKACGESHLDPNHNPGDSYLAFVNYWETLGFNFPSHIKGKWKFDLDLYDLEIGREMCLSSCFAFRPSFGLRCASLEQTYHICSRANHTGVFNGSSYVYTSDVKAHCNFVGAGPRVGLDAEVDLCWGLSLFGSAAGSVVFGKFDRHAREIFKNKDHFFYKFNTFKDYTKGSNDEFASRAITDLSIGLKWDYAFNWLCRPYWISLGLSWEHHGFFNFSNYAFDCESFENLDSEKFEFGPYANLLQSQKKKGDIFTQGLTFSAALGF